MKEARKILPLAFTIFIVLTLSIFGDISIKTKETVAMEITENNYYIESKEVDIADENIKFNVEDQEDSETIDELPIEDHSEINPEDTETEDLSPIIPEAFDTEILEYQIQYNGETLNEVEINTDQVFPQRYTDMEGIITFRGSNLRSSPSFGISSIQDRKLKKIWELTTSTSTWGGGAGWTGQPVIIRWSKEIREIMNIGDEFINSDGFTEVIYGSLGGQVYFIDLHTGKQSRKPIPIKNPIKGSISIDPREYPLLYVGDGINESGRFGYRIFSLIDGSELYFIKGVDSFAYRGWGAFDSSGIVNRNTDTLIEAGENGILYIVKLNTEFNIENKSININPEIIKYRYRIKGNNYQGIENSVAIYKNLAYFGDNGGSIQCIDITSMKPVWALEKSDDTDATITIEVEEDVPYLYTGTEVDKQGTKGFSILRKIDGLNGEILWVKHYECLSILGEKPTNGGALATNIIGKNDLKDMVVFTLARYKALNKSLMIALDKKTGEEIWKWEMPYYAWSSPADFYDKDGKGYIIQCDSIGNMYLLDGITGEILDQINLGANIESSPAIFEDYIVVATRGGKIYGVKIE